MASQTRLKDSCQFKNVFKHKMGIYQKTIPHWNLLGRGFKKRVIGLRKRIKHAMATLKRGKIYFLSRGQMRQNTERKEIKDEIKKKKTKSFSKV